MPLEPSKAANILKNVRHASGVPSSRGPSDRLILAGVEGFVGAFDYWYIRVMAKAVPKYRTLIIMRINTFIRRIELEGMSAAQAAAKLVDDYNSRNFVTAGGWALEEMAVEVSEDSQKSSAEGIDIQRLDRDSTSYHLYVLKSGLVTRNSDIVKALKRNARQAEKLLMQGRATGKVFANYAIAVGKTTSTFEDGIRRPSSAEFWSEMTNLDPDEAISLAFAMAAEAGRLVTADASDHIADLKLLVHEYIAEEHDRNVIDWEFLKRRTMQLKGTWVEEDKRRHQRAMASLKRAQLQREKAAEDRLNSTPADP